MPKPDGGVRVTYSVSKQLKAIQHRILHRLLRRVELPDYLLGSRPGKSYLANVEWHCDAQVLFGEDVASFYPSIHASHVREIFQYFMGFAPDVAQCLTDLCIYENCVPQGAKPSGDLANLVLWRHEPDLVEHFAALGLRYSRYVDDVYVSAMRAIRADEKTHVVSQLHRLFRLEGFKVKRKKHELSTSGQAMRVHRLAVNAGRPTISTAERSRIRAAVRNLEQTWMDLNHEKRSVALARIRGRVARLRRLHPRQYEQLHGRVHALERLKLAAT